MHVNLRPRLSPLPLTWTQLTVPNARSPVRGEGVHALSLFVFLSLHVLVFAAAPLSSSSSSSPHQSAFSSSFSASIAATLLPFSACFGRLPALLCSTSAALHAFSITLPGPVAPLRSPAPHLVPSCQDLRQQTCESSQALYFFKGPFNTPHLNLWSAFIVLGKLRGIITAQRVCLHSIYCVN